ncbi:MAG: hypothetical protein CME62_09230 [Halobacteriovoraceae bacterium]|nr:hypothetical protein [Halobacteriovoraceae bacterium]|tara:strand:+ start:9026 stop:10762 length:1737 start_codon:yes stop_codon:yes gene_type:complete
MTKKLFPLFLIVAIALLSVFLYKRDGGQKNNKINLAINNKIKSFDPAVAFNDDSLLVMGQTLETLYQYHYLKRPFEVIPLLADGMPEISEDGKTYTIKIKKDILYQNHNQDFQGPRTVKAQDFIWQIKRLAFKPLKSTGTWLFEGKLKGFNEFSEKVGESSEKFLTENISGLSAPDEYTLKIELKRPEPNLLYFLSMTFTTPVPLELINNYNNDLSQVLVGTGPYQFRKFDGQSYFFSKFEKFHKEVYPSTGDRYANTENLLSSSKEQLPFIRKIEFKIINDEDLRWREFGEGNIDILDVPKKYLSQLSNPSTATSQEFSKKGIEVKHFSRQTSRWLGFNMNDPLLGKSKNLRRAIAHAIDYSKYIEILTNNTNLKSNSIFNPSIPGYRPSHQLPYYYDLTMAKKYLGRALTELGIKPGELTLTYSTRGKQDIHHEEAAFLQHSLSQIGINVVINEIEFSEFLKLGRAGKLQFWTDNWIYDYPDAENILQLLISKNHPGINKSGYSNKQVDHLYNQLSKTLDKESRFEIMYEIEKIVEQELPWLMLMYESTYIVQQKDIKNFRKSFFIRNYIKYLEKN